MPTPLRLARAAAVALLIVLAAACSSSSSPSGSADCTAPVDGILRIHAEAIRFDTACLALPAGEEVTLVLENADSQPHNMAIYTDSSTTTQLFFGEIVEGGQTMEYTVPALDAGTYFFHCTLHPAMSGSVVVQ